MNIHRNATLTTIPASAGHHDSGTTNIPSARRSRSRAMVAALLSAAIVAISMIGLVDRADAYSVWSSSGRTGNITAFPTSVRAGYQFEVGGVIMNRNGATAYNNIQNVQVTFELQYWNGQTWIWVDRFTASTNIPARTDSKFVSGVTMTPRYNMSARPGYYRVVHVAQWGLNDFLPGRFTQTGSMTFVPTNASEITCAVGGCTASPGYVQIR